MLYVHESNILSKIRSNYGGKAALFQQFYNEKYLPMRDAVLSLTFDEKHLDSFRNATGMFNDYKSELKAFALKNNVKAQSKFESTFLEELSVYLFKDLPKIRDGVYDIFNKGIYAGLKVENDNSITVITKDVDFCIARKVQISIDGAKPIPLIVPIVSVEVKTYLDATMFGEAKSSSKTLRSASPQSTAYILMGYNEVGDEHMIAARQDSTFNEIFALQEMSIAPYHEEVILDYWRVIAASVEHASLPIKIPETGRLLNR